MSIGWGMYFHPAGFVLYLQDQSNKTKQFLRVPYEADWMHYIYQYCNRLATLYFLNQQGISAHLLFIFFTGDNYPVKNCPDSPEEWRHEIEGRDRRAKLPPEHRFNRKVHQLFLNVEGKGGFYHL